MLNRLRAARGQSAVEFSIIMVLIFAFIFTLTDMTIILYNFMGVQHITNHIAREAKKNLSRRELQIEADAAATQLHINPVEVIIDRGSPTVITVKRDVRVTPITAGIFLRLLGYYDRTYPVSIREEVYVSR